MTGTPIAAAAILVAWFPPWLAFRSFRYTGKHRARILPLRPSQVAQLTGILALALIGGFRP